MDKKSLSSEKIVGLVLNVHRDAQPGMLEFAYGHSFAGELSDDALPFQENVKMPMSSKPGAAIKQNYRVDLLINGKMIVELKGGGSVPS